MVAQKCKKIASRNFLNFRMSITPKTHLIKALNSIDSSRPYKRLLQIQKTGGSMELILPGNDFQTSSTVNFSKNIQILEA